MMTHHNDPRARVLHEVVFAKDDVPEPCPECAAGKHGNCDGSTWNNATDDFDVCPCWAAGHDG